MGKNAIADLEELRPEMRELVENLTQPMTVKQWSKKSGIVFRQCRNLFVTARRKKLIKCVNHEAARHRLYFLTVAGLKLRKALLGSEIGQRPLDIPEIDWQLYGECCHSHRAAVLKTMTDSMRSNLIRRFAVKDDPKLKMSTSNTRDVVYWLRSRDLIESEKIGKEPHSYHRLTESGEQFQKLLKQAGAWL